MTLPRRWFQTALAGLLALQTVAAVIPVPTARAQDEPPAATEAPVVDTDPAAAGDWPPLGQNAHRTNARGSSRWRKRQLTCAIRLPGTQKTCPTPHHPPRHASRRAIPIGKPRCVAALPGRR